MSVYHITYLEGLSEICFYFDGGCDFSCHGCITDFNPFDCHLDKKVVPIKNKKLSVEQVLSYLKSLAPKRAVFLGKEPTHDIDFLPLAKVLKEHFSSYNILLTNGYRYVNDNAINEVCVSIKAISKEIFKDFTGRDNPEQVLTNFKRYKANPQLEVRAESIFIPDYIDQDEIEKIAKFIASVNDSIPFRIDGYIPFGKDAFRRPSKDEMEEIKMIARRYLENVSILHSEVKLKHKVRKIY